MSWTLDDSANNCRWRVGRKRGRNIYAQEGEQPSDEDPFLGIMETEGIADSVVENHNRSRGRTGSGGKDTPAERTEP